MSWLVRSKARTHTVKGGAKRREKAERRQSSSICGLRINVWLARRSFSLENDLFRSVLIIPRIVAFSERFFLSSSVTIKSDAWFEFSQVAQVYTPKKPDRFSTQRLHKFTKLISLLHLGLPSLPFPNTLVSRALSLPSFYFTSSAVSMFFYVMRRVKTQ